MQEDIDESVIEPFLVASYSKNTMKLLKFLFITPSLLQASPEVSDLLVLPEVKGEENKEYGLVKELIRSRTKYRLEKIFTPFMEFVSRIIKEATVLVAMHVKEGERLDEIEMSTKVMGFVITKMKEYEKELPNLVSKVAIPFLRSIMGGLSIVLADYVLERWKMLNKFELEYHEILNIMKKLSIIQPLLQVIVCPYCSLTSFTISDTIIDVNHCPRCGKQPLIGTLYVLDENLARLKQAHEDIVHFIAVYLKYRSLEGYPLSIPSIKIKHYIKGKFEVNVYVEELNYGIECKVFDFVGAVTRERIENWLKELKPKIDSYASAGVKYMLIVTNLEEGITRILKTKLSEYINEREYDIKLEDVLGANPEKLLEKLNDIARRISEEVQQRMKKEVEAKIKARIKEELSK